MLWGNQLIYGWAYGQLHRRKRTRCCKSDQESLTEGLIGPRDELTVIILLNGHNIPLFSNLYLYIQRLVRLSEQVLCAVDEWLLQKPTRGTAKTSLFSATVGHPFPLPKAQRSLWTRCWKDYKSQRLERTGQDCLLEKGRSLDSWTHSCGSLHEACTGVNPSAAQC